jgi:CMP-N,N'-diacetyllegionaminic acid synthase
MNILGIIPARGGSKRVPQKNFRPFAGTTLTDIAIQQGLESKLITCLAVSTDSEAIMEIAGRYKGLTGIKRPAEISNDESPAIDYLRHGLEFLEKNQAFDMVVILQPSSPLRCSSDIDATIRLLIDNPDADSAVSVVKVDHMVHPYKLKTMQQYELLSFIEDEAGRFASHELPDVFVRNCAVYVSWRKDLENRNDVIGNKSLGYLMPAETSVDINEMLDFEFAEFLYVKRHQKSH